jgi:hypothetical protein
MTMVMALVFTVRIFAAQPVGEPNNEADRKETSGSFLLGPPKDEGPVVVRTSFHFNNINYINDEEETFAFTGVLTLKWNDKRQIFDPAKVGVDEKVYQGDYQFDELFTGWYPQVVLINESGLCEKNGVVLRVLPDGTLTLVETLNAIARVDLDLRRFPFDKQRLEAVFEVLGFDKSKVVLQAESYATSSSDDQIKTPQWTVLEISMSTRDRTAFYAGCSGVTSAFVVSVDAQRESFFVSRLVVVPLILIVLLSFSVFWMDRSSLGDRISVSFIGILTAVTYQLVMSEIQPRISYVTFMNGFLNISFFLMCATVVINLVVGEFDKKGKFKVGDRIDRYCRWIFPLTFFAIILLLLGVAFLYL